MSGIKDVCFFSNSGLTTHFVIPLDRCQHTCLIPSVWFCTTEVGNGSQNRIGTLALKSRFVFPEKPQSFCEEAVQLHTLLGSLLQQAVTNCGKWLSTGFGSRLLGSVDRTAELCPALRSLSSCRRWDWELPTFLLALLRQQCVAGWDESVNSFLQCRGILQLAASSWILRAKGRIAGWKSSRELWLTVKCLCSLSQRHECLGGADEPTNMKQELLKARGGLDADGDDFINALVCCLGHDLILSVPRNSSLSNCLQTAIETVSSVKFP